MKYKHKKKFVWQGYVKLSNLNEKKGAKYMSQKDMNTHEWMRLLIIQKKITQS